MRSIRERLRVRFSLWFDARVLDRLEQIMSKLDELNAKVDELQTALDAEQEQIRGSIATLNATIDELRSQIGTGVTDAQLQAVIDRLDGVKTDLESTVPPPEPEVPQE